MLLTAVKCYVLDWQQEGRRSACILHKLSGDGHSSSTTDQSQAQNMKLSKGAGTVRRATIVFVCHKKRNG